ncbi:MAG: hypothetical protein IJV59_00270 [Eubacterium sp.]|nr:hypothetical protein [Eubacterium sp.]MBQ9022928.1 hypothetical protein [Eubacterium sp.]
MGVGYAACAAFLCYRSVFGLASAVLIIPFYHKMREAERKERREQTLTKQFCDAMQAVSASLRTGASIERAFLDGQKEVARMYGNDTEFACGLAVVNKRVQMNEPLEEVFLKFAYRTQAPEIISFAESFRYAKRSGADMPHMIRTVVDRVSEKEMILENIRTMVSAKRMEQKLMLLLVPGVLLFVTVSSPEYAKSLYHALPGIVLMTGCLLGYLFAAWWGRRIVTIRV